MCALVRLHVGGLGRWRVAVADDRTTSCAGERWGARIGIDDLGVDSEGRRETSARRPDR